MIKLSKNYNLNSKKPFFGKLFQIVPLILFFIFVVYGIFTEDLDSLIRYDKYQIYISTERSLLILLSLIFAYLCLLKVSGGLYKVLYPSNLFSILLIIFILPGVLLTSDFSAIGSKSFYSYLAAFILFFLGMVTINLIAPGKDNKSNPGPTVVYHYNSKTFIAMISLFFIGFIYAIFRFDFTESILNFFLIFIESGVNSTAAELRQISPSRNFFDIFYSYAVSLFMPLTCVFFLSNGLISKNRKQIIVAMVMIILTFFLLISDGGRLKGLFFILYISVAYSLISGLKISQIINLGASLLWLLIVQTILLGRIATAAGAESTVGLLFISLNRVIERVILTKGFVTQQVFHYIPDAAPYKNGSTFLNTLLGQTSETISLDQEMFNFIYGGGYQGTAGPQSFGELYANFGIFGMLVGAFIVGLFIQLITVFIKKYFALDAFKISFLAYITVLFSRIGYSGLFSFKSNGLHILAILFIIFVIIRIPFRKTKTNY